MVDKGHGAALTVSAQLPATQKNFLILRASPDWLSFDLECSRQFLKSFALPETLIIDFAALWNRHFKVDYCGVRAQLKELALQTYNEVRHATLIRHEEWQETTESDGWVAFVDDDDWMSPRLFESLPAPAAADAGARWGSLRLGRVFAQDGYAVPIIQHRPLDRILYTNNYAVTMQAIHRRGRAAFFGHDAAQKSFDEPDFDITTAENYLSCAVKHPCCTMSVNYLMSRGSFRSDPRREMAHFMDSLNAASVDGIEEWLRRPFARFREVLRDATQPR